MTEAERTLLLTVAERLKDGERPTNADLVVLSEAISRVRDERVRVEAFRAYAAKFNAEHPA